MNRLSIFALACAIGLFASGCASTGGNLQRETARSIGENVSPEQVTVTDVNQGITDVQWKAATPTGNYNCSADDMLRRVYCTKNK